MSSINNTILWVTKFFLWRNRFAPRIISRKYIMSIVNKNLNIRLICRYFSKTYYRIATQIIANCWNSYRSIVSIRDIKIKITANFVIIIPAASTSSSFNRTLANAILCSIAFRRAGSTRTDGVAVRSCVVISSRIQSYRFVLGRILCLCVSKW